MKNKIAIILTGFMSEYINSFLKLCESHNIKADLFCSDKNHPVSRCIENVFYIDNTNNKKIKDIKNFDIALRKKLNPVDYDYILSDCQPISFGCNVFHGVTTACRMECSPFFLYKVVFFLTHIKKLFHEKNFYKSCPKNIAVSSKLRDDYAKHCCLKEDSIIVAYPGINAANNTEMPEMPAIDEVFKIGMSANGFVTKGGYVLLESIRFLKKNNPEMNLKVKIIHSKFKKNLPLKLYLKLTGLEKIVEIYPFQKDMEKFYRSLNCFVCPSKYEAFGRVAPEAMMYRVPAIVSSDTGVSDIVKDGENGYIFKAGKDSSKNLAEKINYVYEHYQKLDKITQKAYDTASEITWENFAKTIFYAFYPELAKIKTPNTI